MRSEKYVRSITHFLFIIIYYVLYKYDEFKEREWGDGLKRKAINR